MPEHLLTSSLTEARSPHLRVSKGRSEKEKEKRLDAWPASENSKARQQLNSTTSPAQEKRLSKRRRVDRRRPSTLLHYSPSSGSKTPRYKSSDTSSWIQVWLDYQPSPQRQHEPYQPQRSSRKRQRSVDDQQLDRPSRIRKHLMPVSGNTMESEGLPSNRNLRSSNLPQMTTPTHERRSKKSQILPSQERPPDSPDSPQRLDPDPTPRPQARRPNGLPPMPNFEPGSREASSESRGSRGSKPRSQSPTKNLGDFQFAETPVDLRAWSADIIPQELKALVDDMKKIALNIGVIPSAVRKKFVQVREDVYPFQFSEDLVNQYRKSSGEKDGGSRVEETKSQATERVTGGLGHDLFWYRVNMIHQASTECLVGTKPEAAWNSEVHSSLLRLALEGYWAAKELWYEDITQARIANNSRATQPKMVDYAIVINPSREFSGEPCTSLHNRIIERLNRQGGDAGINQTMAEWVRFKPIAINIETKKGAVSEVEGHVQLGTWLTAQYTRLRQLCGTEKDTKGRYMNQVPLPSFPVLFAQGQRWLMMIACIRDNGRIDLIRELYLGETGSVAGVYQLIAAIRRLAQWVHDDYRPWFERQVLDVKEGT